MTLDRTALRTSINDLYRREHEELGDDGGLDIGASDATDLYDASAPSWAAGGPIEFRRAA